MRTTLFVLLLFANLFSKAQSKPIMSALEMKEDFVYLRNYLENTHPMLYIHHDQKVMQNKMDSLASTMDQSLPFLEFYKKIAQLITLIGCEHTYCNYGEGFDRLLKSAAFFPYQLHFRPNGVKVLVNLTLDQDISFGDELLSINGRSIESIRLEMHKYVPSDGWITTSKDNSMSSLVFSVWYYLFIEQAKEFIISVKTKKGEIITKTIKAIKMEKLNKNAVSNPVNKQLIDLDSRMKVLRKEILRVELLPQDRAAVLSVQSFSSDMYRFRNQLDSCFRLIVENRTEKLIIDLAGNGGGEVELAADLLNYFIKKPTSLVEYSYLITDKDEDLKLANVPDEVRKAKYNYIYPLQNGKSYTKLSRYAGELKMLQPLNNRFTGKVYLFVDGGTASAASTFTAVMKSLNLGKVVGQETAGAYAGGGTVIGLDLKLPNSKITVHSGLIYQRFRTIGGEPHRGVIPDVTYMETLEDLLTGRELWKKFILGLD